MTDDELFIEGMSKIDPDDATSEAWQRLIALARIGANLAIEKKEKQFYQEGHNRILLTVEKLSADLASARGDTMLRVERIEEMENEILVLQRDLVSALEALEQVLGWTDNWETSFDDYDEWLETRHRAAAELAKHKGK